MYLDIQGPQRHIFIILLIFSAEKKVNNCLVIVKNFFFFNNLPILLERTILKLHISPSFTRVREGSSGPCVAAISSGLLGSATGSCFIGYTQRHAGQLRAETRCLFLSRSFFFFYLFQIGCKSIMKHMRSHRLRCSSPPPPPPNYNNINKHSSGAGLWATLASFDMQLLSCVRGGLCVYLEGVGFYCAF